MDYDTTNDINQYAEYMNKYNPGETSVLLPFVQYTGAPIYTAPITNIQTPTLPNYNIPDVIKSTSPLFSTSTPQIVTPIVPKETPITANIKISKGQTGVAKDMVSFLTNKGLSKEAASGVVGNLMVESGLNTTAGGDKGTSFGLAQWRDPTVGQGRWTNLKNFSTARGLDNTSVNGQMEYLWHELNNSYSGVLSKIKEAKTPEDAAELFRKHFENPAPNAKMESLRRQYARKFYNS